MHDTRLVVSAILLAFLGLLLVGHLAGLAGEDALLLPVVGLIGSMVIAVPFLFLRFCGVTRRATVLWAALVALISLLLGLIRGDIHMGHYATIPGWWIGLGFAVWVSIIGPVAAFAVLGSRRQRPTDRADEG